MLADGLAPDDWQRGFATAEPKCGTGQFSNCGRAVLPCGSDPRRAEPLRVGLPVAHQWHRECARGGASGPVGHLVTVAGTDVSTVATATARSTDVATATAANTAVDDDAFSNGDSVAQHPFSSFRAAKRCFAR
jgi:hypothetical protein